MKVACSRHPGASTIGSQLLDETAPMAGNPSNPAMSPHAEGKKGICHTVISTVGKRRVGGEQPRDHAQM